MCSDDSPLRKLVESSDKLANAPPPPDLAPDAAAGKPTRTRYGVLGFLCSLSFVLYLDRVCIGQAAVPIQRDLGFVPKTTIDEGVPRFVEWFKAYHGLD